MLRVRQVTSRPFQRQVAILESGAPVELTFYYRPQQSGWFVERLVYQDFVLLGTRITVSPNFLHQWRNKIPFGMACFTTANREPTLQQDFSSEAAKLYLLNPDEVTAYTEYLQLG